MIDYQESHSKELQYRGLQREKRMRIEHINIYGRHLAVKGKRKLEDLERVPGLNKNFLFLQGREEVR